MALEKTKELETGASGNYWKITGVQIDRISNNTMVEVYLYKDSTARSADKLPMETKQYVIRPSGDPVVNPFSVAAMDETNPVAIAYVELKKLDDFSGAIDV